MNYWALVLCCFVTLGAGCAFLPVGDTADITYYGDVNASGSDFEMNGYVASEGGGSADTTFRNVSVRLYSGDGEPLCEYPAGDLEANHGRLNVSFGTSSRPEYVIIESDDFWREDVEVDYFVLDTNDGSYTRKEATDRGDYPIEITGATTSACSALSGRTPDTSDSKRVQE